MRNTTKTLILYITLISQSLAVTNLSENIPRANLNPTSEFVFETYPNQELISIRLLGAIKNSGLYHIPQNMKLTTLLALAGGTTTEADLENIVIGKDYDGKNKPAKKIDLEESLMNGLKNDYTLSPNDIVLVKNKTSVISNDSFRSISIISVILSSILTAVIIKDRYKK